MSDAPERIWAWRKTEPLSRDHARMSYNWIGGQIPKPSNEGTDFLAGYIRADLSPDPALFAEVVEALRGLHHAVCGETGFAACVRLDTGKAYPWPALDEADKATTAILAKLEARDGT